MSTLDLIIDFLTKHWEGLASLLLSAVSIWIAIYSARSTSKDAARQIASVTSVIAAQGMNIDDIKRLTGRIPLDKNARIPKPVWNFLCVELLKIKNR
jgi:hypothetical protein